MARKSPQQFIKRQKEMERARKAKEKMAKRQGKKSNKEMESDPTGTGDKTVTSDF
ncbi:MAG: hypothetical protein M0P57_10645 [Syntrophales bacterium]|jgi:hypothetical protein|nr:hypothetical protein [Syntrophales bacterium]MDY0044088.1 hypothetical protein [Syntrophales bacterium]